VKLTTPNMFKTILVPVNGGPDDQSALDAAFAVARLFNSHLHCVRVRPNPAGLLWEGELMDVAAGALTGHLMKELNAKASNRTKQALDHVKAFCDREKIPLLEMPVQSDRPSASWTELVGHQVAQLVAQARVHDLAVVAGDLLKETDPMADLTGDMLLFSGRPLLIAKAKVPDEFAERIVIAWNNTAASARAVAAVMPILSVARKIIILCAEENGISDIESARALADNLAWNSLTVECRPVAVSRGTVADAVAKEATRLGASLVVSGGFGHRRSREIVYGGFTKDIMTVSSVPVLLFH
jgi:nucleotide-binding universal stress UspA family protein